MPSAFHVRVVRSGDGDYDYHTLAGLLQSGRAFGAKNRLRYKVTSS